MKIVEMPQISIAKTQNILRAVADEIDEGVYGKVIAGLIIIENEDGEIETFGGGKCDYIYVYLLLQKAILKQAGVI